MYTEIQLKDKNLNELKEIINIYNLKIKKSSIKQDIINMIITYQNDQLKKQTDNRKQEQYEPIFKSKITIDKIIHISDIHIKNNGELYGQYIELLDNIIKIINTIEGNKIVVITGDLLDKSNNLSIESINLTMKFLMTLKLHVNNVVLISGNHDIRSQGMDTLYGLNEFANIDYLYNSGLYIFGNILFCVSSRNDNKYITYNQVKQYKNDYKLIGLYHGMFKNHHFANDNDPDLNDYINYDMVLLGDIHTPDILKSHIRYVGSPIQLSFNESYDNHGLLCWTVENNSAEFIPIPNNYGKFKLIVNNNNIILPDYIPLYPSFHIILYNSDENYVKNIVNSIPNSNIKYVDNKNIIERFEKQYNTEINEVYDKKYIFDYITKNYELSDNQKYILDKITINIFNNIKLPNYEHNFWEPLNLHMHNLRSYNDTSIDFEKLKHKTTIIIGNNATGKSNIINNFIYSMSNGFTKSSINSSATACESNLNIKIGHQTHNIIHYYNGTNNRVFLDLNGRKKTDDTYIKENDMANLTNLVGTYNNFNTFNLFNIKSSSIFTDDSKKERINIIKNIFGLDVFENISNILIKNNNYYAPNDNHFKLSYNKEFDNLNNQLLENNVHLQHYNISYGAISSLQDNLTLLNADLQLLSSGINNKQHYIDNLYNQLPRQPSASYNDIIKELSYYSDYSISLPDDVNISDLYIKKEVLFNKKHDKFLEYDERLYHQYNYIISSYGPNNDFPNNILDLFSNLPNKNIDAISTELNYLKSLNIILPDISLENLKYILSSINDKFDIEFIKSHCNINYGELLQPFIQFKRINGEIKIQNKKEIIYDTPRIFDETSILLYKQAKLQKEGVVTSSNSYLYPRNHYQIPIIANQALIIDQINTAIPDIHLGNNDVSICPYNIDINDLLRTRQKLMDCGIDSKYMECLITKVSEITLDISDIYSDIIKLSNIDNTLNNLNIEYNSLVIPKMAAVTHGLSRINKNITELRCELERLNYSPLLVYEFIEYEDFDALMNGIKLEIQNINIIPVDRPDIQQMNNLMAMTTNIRNNILTSIDNLKTKSLSKKNKEIIINILEKALNGELFNELNIDRAINIINKQISDYNTYINNQTKVTSLTELYNKFQDKKRLYTIFHILHEIDLQNYEIIKQKQNEI